VGNCFPSTTPTWGSRGNRRCQQRIVSPSLTEELFPLLREGVKGELFPLLRGSRENCFPSLYTGGLGGIVSP